MDGWMDGGCDRGKLYGVGGMMIQLAIIFTGTGLVWWEMFCGGDGARVVGK